MKILYRYTAFAIFATLLNLLGQELSLIVYQGAYSLYLAMGVGTAAGLICKYILDRLFIFGMYDLGWNEDLNRFVAYSLTGLFTTLIFWSFELGFEFLFASKTARYIGAIIGLGCGYVVKYRLDKRYVFVGRAA